MANKKLKKFGKIILSSACFDLRFKHVLEFRKFLQKKVNKEFGRGVYIIEYSEKISSEIMYKIVNQDKVREQVNLMSSIVHRYYAEYILDPLVQKKTIQNCGYDTF